MADSFKPQILVYYCSDCNGPRARGGLALDHISDSISSMHFKCAREVTPDQIRSGFLAGADGILICGCLVRDCDTESNDLAVLRSLFQNQVALRDLGLVTDRLREEWVVQGTTDRLEQIVTEFLDLLQTLGPAKPLRSASTPPKEMEGRG